MARTRKGGKKINPQGRQERMGGVAEGRWGWDWPSGATAVRQDFLQAGENCARCCHPSTVMLTLADRFLSANSGLRGPT